MTELKCFKRSKGAENELSEQVLQIKVDDIRPNRAQPRAKFDQNSIIRLADSIRRYGILQPLTVRESDPDDSCKYELIAGERRLRAARMLGYLTVPCIIKGADNEVSAELAIIFVLVPMVAGGLSAGEFMFGLSDLSLALFAVVRVFTLKNANTQ